MVFEVNIALEIIKKGGHKWGSVSVRGLALSVCQSVRFSKKEGGLHLLIEFPDDCWGSRFFEVGLRFSVSFLRVSARDISDGVENGGPSVVRNCITNRRKWGWRKRSVGPSGFGSFGPVCGL